MNGEKLHNEIGHNILHITGTAFGIDLEKHRTLIANYVEVLDEIQDILLERFRKPWLHSEFVYNWTTLKSKETKVLKVLNDLTDTVSN